MEPANEDSRFLVSWQEFPRVANWRSTNIYRTDKKVLPIQDHNFHKKTILNEDQTAIYHWFYCLKYPLNANPLY